LASRSVLTAGNAALGFGGAINRAGPPAGVTPATSTRTDSETRRYEDSVIDVLRENLGRLLRGEASLRNQIV
jgi:hypothetical protein